MQKKVSFPADTFLLLQKLYAKREGDLKQNRSGHRRTNRPADRPGGISGRRWRHCPGKPGCPLPIRLSQETLGHLLALPLNHSPSWGCPTGTTFERRRECEGVLLFGAANGEGTAAHRSSTAEAQGDQNRGKGQKATVGPHFHSKAAHSKKQKPGQDMGEERGRKNELIPGAGRWDGD
jgi:hypothetical protein